MGSTATIHIHFGSCFFFSQKRKEDCSESVSIHSYTKGENHPNNSGDNKTQIELFITRTTEVVHELQRTSQLIHLNGVEKRVHFPVLYQIACNCCDIYITHPANHSVAFSNSNNKFINRESFLSRPSTLICHWEIEWNDEIETSGCIEKFMKPHRFIGCNQ